MYANALQLVGINLIGKPVILSSKIGGFLEFIDAYEFIRHYTNF